RPLLLAFLLAAVSPSGVEAQALPLGAWPFGASQDPTEAPPATFVQGGGHAAAYAAPAFLGASWRAAVAIEGAYRSGAFSAALGGTLHSGRDGFYRPEPDEAYDLARLVRYVRLDPTPGFPVYARLGPPTGVTTGHGLLVRGYRSTTAWDERTVGAEAQ